MSKLLSQKIVYGINRLIESKTFLAQIDNMEINWHKNIILATAPQPLTCTAKHTIFCLE